MFLFLPETEAGIGAAAHAVAATDNTTTFHRYAVSISSAQLFAPEFAREHDIFSHFFPLVRLCVNLTLPVFARAVSA